MRGHTVGNMDAIMRLCDAADTRVDRGQQLIRLVTLVA